MGDRDQYGKTGHREDIPLLSMLSSRVPPDDDDANNNDTNTKPVIESFNIDASDVRGCDRDNNILNRAPPAIYIVRPSSNRESTTSRVDYITDESTNNFVKPTRKPSNRFLVNTRPLEEHLNSPTSPSSPEKSIEDDVFTSIGPTISNLQVPNVNIFNHELPQFNREISTDSQDTNVLSVSRITIQSVGQSVAGKIAKQGRRFANRQTQRLVSKDGSCNIVSKNVARGHNSWSRDIFTTLLDLRWRYIILVFAAVLVGSWFFFAILWWAISVLHGDHLDYYRPIDESNATNFTVIIDSLSNSTQVGNASRVSHDESLSNNTILIDVPTIENQVDRLPCVEGVHNFITAILFSVETQQTIGYGTRYITANCFYGIILLVAQSCTGMVLLALTTGIIHSKVCKPKSRAHTMMFSRFAVICLRDDEYCLLFRVGDMRRSYLIGTSIRALVVKAKQDEKLNPLSQYTLELENDLKDSSPFLIWPVTMVHRINESSPLWHLSLEQLIEAKFEIIIVLEGTIEHTGMTAQFRTSYLPSEILWGYHLAPLLTYQKQNGKYEIDFTLFHDATPIENMPEYSAMMYARKWNSEDKKVVGSNPTDFATGGFKRNGSQSLWSRGRSSRKKLKIKDVNSPEVYINEKSAMLKSPVPQNNSINRFSIQSRSIFRSFKERPRSTKS